MTPANVHTEELSWLWEDRTILGSLGLVSGDAGGTADGAGPAVTAGAQDDAPATGLDTAAQADGDESLPGNDDAAEDAAPALADATAVTAPQVTSAMTSGPVATFSATTTTTTSSASTTTTAKPEITETDSSGTGPAPAHAGHEHEPTITPPGEGATQAEIDAYVAAVKAQPEDEAHGTDPGKAAQHEAVMELVPRDEATHIAVSDGDWFDPGTWYNGQIPGDGAKVLIPEGISVTYDDVSDARLFTVRVDGELTFDSHSDSRMVFDTMVVSPTGTLTIGSETDPVDAGVKVELVVANNGPIDTAWDPMLLSRGVISHGDVSIHGAEKDSHEKVVTDPMAGDTELSFAEIPEGWQVGDQLVIAGTRFDGHKWDGENGGYKLTENQDEVRTIVEIRDGKVILDSPLEFDHDTPRDDLKTSVANMTRNVVIQSEDGAASEAYERGHVMFMHSDNVDVRYAQFQDLGRTDKSVESKDISDITDVQYDSNVQGRYALHLHKTGVGDPDSPAMVVGNAVWGSPGWGFVQHDSNAILDNNASFDTFGAGFVAETGNETGVWNNNIAIYAPGNGWGQAKSLNQIGDDIFDVGRSGDGFWFQGRMVDATNNIAASVNHGFVYFHRDGNNTMIDFDAKTFKYPDIFYGDPETFPDRAPILGFRGNEAFAANRGLEIVKNGLFQGHDVWTHIDKFLAWSVRTGIVLDYTTQYLMTNLDLIAKDSVPFSEPEDGIILGPGTADIVIRDSKIDGFQNGINFDNTKGILGITLDLTNYFVVDTVITDTVVPLLGYEPEFMTVTDSSALKQRPVDIVLDPLSFVNNTVVITGTKVDSLGRCPFPSEAHPTMFLDQYDVVKMLEKNGYWLTAKGDAYFLLDVYYTDRLTGEIYFERVPVTLDAGTALRLANNDQPWAADYKNVSLNGVKNPSSDNDVKFRVLEDGIERIVIGDSADERIAGIDIADVIFGKGGADSIRGAGGDDHLKGGDGTDSLRGEQGHDTLEGGGLADSLSGGSGDDVLMGGGGRDTLDGDGGNDTLTGGLRRDFFIFDEANFGTDTITNFGNDMIVITTEGEALTRKELRAALTEVDGNVVYDHMADGRNVIVIEDMTLADLQLRLFDLV